MSRYRPTRLSLLGLAGIAILIGAAPAGGGYATPALPVRPVSTAPETAAATAPAEKTVLDEVWELVRQRFYDPNLHGIDWEAARKRYRPAFLAASSEEARAAVINDMLAELGASHTHYYVADDPAYYQLADIFSGALRHELKRVFPSGEVTYPGIGIFTRSDAGRLFVTGVIEGAPAQRAGLLVGDEILAANGAPFRPVESFRGKAGTRVVLSIRRSAGEPVQELPVVPEMLRPNRMFLRGLRESARILPGPGGARIGYVHVWSYAGYEYQRALERLISEAPLKDADALIWDLRGGWGGAEPEYLDLFDRREPTLTVTDRHGRSTILNAKWRRPAAMLTDGGTRSGKEILAYGFKKYHVGEVIGTPTAKAVLAATAFLMSDGSLLLLPVEDVRVDGARLEGVGVTPTIEVPFEPEYAAGHDPQLARAVMVLSKTVRG
jgi:carboxyl-terminal processing protease